MLNKVYKVTDYVISVYAKNLTFGVFMYILGCVVAWTTLPNTKGAALYDNLYWELFMDVSILCLFLRVLPEKVRKVVTVLFSVVAYLAALVDVYCFISYDTTINPSMVMLLNETNSKEAGEFLSTIFSSEVIFSDIRYIISLAMLNIVAAFVPKRLPWQLKNPYKAGIALVLCGVFIASTAYSWHNKKGLYRLMTAANIGEVEHILTEKDHGATYQPLYRIAFSMYANSLTAQQIVKLRDAADKIEVDSCSYASPHIVLIIGESFSRHHSSQYGYWQKTTPRQEELEKIGRLTKFTDVVSPWNLTSFVFKLMFSTYTVGDEGEWCDYPLFPELFKAAGYHVTFITNQFLPQAKQAVYDFSGGFFLNDSILSRAQFDSRNKKLYRYDESLLKVYEKLQSEEKEHNLTIFHLAGQHVAYKQRSPRDRKHFKRDEYLEAKPHLSDKERQTLADYDNAILYNDSVVTEIAKTFDDKDAIVIYVPDHGEECYEGNMHFICRMHSAKIDYRLAHAEFDIPFWIYTTETYQKNHPEVCKRIKEAQNRRFMTDALPHLLLDLAGIHSKDYHEEYSLISPKYNEKRKRILKNTTDYDELKPSGK